MFQIRTACAPLALTALLAGAAVAVGPTTDSFASSSTVHRAGAQHDRHGSSHRRSRRHDRRHTKTVHVDVTRGGRGGAAVGDDYPVRWKNRPLDSVLDDWRMYNRECVSFVAFRLASRAGYRMPFFANAKDWGDRARARGIRVDDTPVAGSVGWSSAGKWGHVVWVADVEGSTVTIEQYNADFTGRYSWAKVPASRFKYIHFADPAPAPAAVQPASESPIQGSSEVLQGGSGQVLQPAAPLPSGGGGHPVTVELKPAAPTPGSSGSNPAPAPATTPPPPSRQVLTVDNRVTSGMGMREDISPARLTTQTWTYCGRRGCNINGTERSTGGTFDAAVCQTLGERTTNGNDGDSADDGNPERFESTRYYGVRLGNGTFGYISEVWIRAADRGGLGLPSC